MFRSQKEHFGRLLLIFILLLFFSSFSHATELVRIGFVADGDTVRLEDRRWVRLAGIDAPERIDGEKGSCAGKFSRDKLLGLLAGNRIVLEERGKDRYGRILGKLYLENGLCVNDEMIRAGGVWVLIDGKPDTFGRGQIALQQEAIQKKAGIWAMISGRSPSVVGNKNSYKFHEKDCSYGKKISPKNRIYFNSYLDAFKQGYAPARECVRDPVCP